MNTAALVTVLIIFTAFVSWDIVTDDDAPTSRSP